MLRLEGIHAGYSAVKVLHGVSIAVEAGAFVSMVGPNGAGKTTLFKTISGIVAPSAGSIEFEGVEVSTDRRDVAGLVSGRQEVCALIQLQASW